MNQTNGVYPPCLHIAMAWIKMKNCLCFVCCLCLYGFHLLNFTGYPAYKLEELDYKWDCWKCRLPYSKHIGSFLLKPGGAGPVNHSFGPVRSEVQTTELANLKHGTGARDGLSSPGRICSFSLPSLWLLPQDSACVYRTWNNLYRHMTGMGKGISTFFVNITISPMV